ncbi:MAG: lysophospholipid acyltransferase family protein [Planctomycetota bacterium]
MTGRDPLTFRERCLVALGALAGVCLTRLLGCTWRIRQHGKDYHADRRAGSPTRVIYSLWHNSLLALAYRYRNQRACTVISEHRDGELIARIVQRLGYETARGSSTHGGVKAFKSVARYARSGSADIAFTPDGPKGPVHKVKSGIVLAGSVTAFPVVPLAIAVDRCWRLRSWDRFMIPKPFARIEIVAGEELHIPRGLSEQELEAWCRRLEEAMVATAERAAVLLAEDMP